jgi:predicted neutral ceramidase superfamily lipid hydrolase
MAKIIKRIVCSSCIINTVTILLITLLADSIPALKKTPFKLTTILLILAFSFTVGAINLILTAKRPGTFARIVIHYAALTLAIFLFAVIFGGFAGEASSRSSVVLLALVIYTVVYAITAIIVCAIRRKLCKSHTEETQTYESQF